MNLRECTLDRLSFQVVVQSKIQPLDVSINRPFKDSLRRSWVGYMGSQVDCIEAGTEKIPKPS